MSYMGTSESVSVDLLRSKDEFCSSPCGHAPWRRITREQQTCWLGPIYIKCERQHPFLSDSIMFNENTIASIIAKLSLTLGVKGPLQFLTDQKSKH